MVRDFDIVVAMDRKRGIGKDGRLPWHLAGDMKHFRELTCAVTTPGHENAVIMGRSTWESIPPKFRPLPNRFNVVLSQNAEYKLPPGVLRAATLDRALELPAGSLIEKCFVIGGGMVYEQALNHDNLVNLYVTQLNSIFDCDTFFPQFERDFSLVSESENMEENGVSYCFRLYQRKSHE